MCWVSVFTLTYEMKLNYDFIQFGYVVRFAMEKTCWCQCLSTAQWQRRFYCPNNQHGNRTSHMAIAVLEMCSNGSFDYSFITTSTDDSHERMYWRPKQKHKLTQDTRRFILVFKNVINIQEKHLFSIAHTTWTKMQIDGIFHEFVWRILCFWGHRVQKSKFSWPQWE